MHDVPHRLVRRLGRRQASAQPLDSGRSLSCHTHHANAPRLLPSRFSATARDMPPPAVGKARVGAPFGALGWREVRRFAEDVNPGTDCGVMTRMRSLLVGLLALSAVACTTSNEPDLVPAPSNFVEAELWEYESVYVPLGFVPSYVTAVYVEVTACLLDSGGRGSLFVSTAFEEVEVMPGFCSEGMHVERLWLDTGAPHEVWLDVVPYFTRDETTVIATFEVLGW